MGVVGGCNIYKNAKKKIIHQFGRKWPCLYLLIGKFRKNSQIHVLLVDALHQLFVKTMD